VRGPPWAGVAGGELKRLFGGGRGAGQDGAGGAQEGGRCGGHRAQLVASPAGHRQVQRGRADLCSGTELGVVAGVRLPGDLLEDPVGGEQHRP